MTKSRLHPLVTASAVISLLFLYLPMLAVIVVSVNASRHGFAWRGFTLDWYRKLLQDEMILEAARNTIILAGVSTLLAVLIGTPLAYGLARFPWPARLRKGLDFLIYLPVVSPDIILAAALVVAFGVLRMMSDRFNPGLFTMILGHVTFQISFVALVVGSRLASIGPELEEAARDLYADTWHLLRRVILPLLLPGIVAGGMLAFTLSLDDFIISFFTAGPGSTTLPIFIYSSLRRGVTPEIHALSTLIFFLNVALVLGLERLTRMRR